MMYCIEIQKEIREDNLTLYNDFYNEPNREEVEKYIISEDVGYDFKYCKFEYWVLKEKFN